LSDGYAYYKEWDDLVKAADDEAKERLELVGRECQTKKVGIVSLILLRLPLDRQSVEHFI